MYRFCGIQKVCNSWEKQFLNSISYNIKTKKPHTFRQKFWYEKILVKYPNPKKKEIKQTVTIKFKKIKPREWQLEAYQKWVNNNYNGIIDACTGSGKSHVALMAIEKESSKLKHACQTIRTVVPIWLEVWLFDVVFVFETTFLLCCWFRYTTLDGGSY